MALAAGVKLGPYEIESPLGAGGMGEVYRARDTRLDRTVAIKVLPPHLSEDPMLRQRFEREAKAISRLNHPHICVLHDVGSQDGTAFLVMECVEGETLAKRLERGPLPVDQVLKYGMQIADALDKAHRSGIVHRDLKPGNIILTASGAKLLDFGLAKNVPPLSVAATLTAATTESNPVTEQGTVVGTFQYMSPEQVVGKEVDARSDIFSLGSVLYEMVTGQRAFPGKSRISVASAILEKEAEPIAKLQPLTPPALDHTIQLCLAKDPEERWQSCRDLLLQLNWIARSGSQAEMPSTVVPHRWFRERVVWLAIAVAVAVIAGLAGWRAARVSTARPLMHLSAQLPAGVTIDRFASGKLALSPDGMHIVLAEGIGNPRLSMRAIDESQFAPLRGGEGGTNPVFSPDGQWIAFFSPSPDGKSKLKKIAVGGGELITLCEIPAVFRGVSWGDDGFIVAAFNQGSAGLMRIPSGGGAPEPVTQLRREEGEIAHAWPQVLPGSQAILFTVFRSGSEDEAEIDVISLKTGARRTIHRGSSFGRYLLSGHFVYLEHNKLFAAAFDLSRLTLAGAPQPVLEDVNTSRQGGGDFDFSNNGTLVYVGSSGPSFQRRLFWLDSAGRTMPLHDTPGPYENPRLSPDGRRLAFETSRGGPMQADIWVKDLERDTLSRVTHELGRNNYPVWTPDGKAIIFASYNRAEPGMFWVRSDGSGEAQRLTHNDSTILQWPRSISRDGRRMAYEEFKVNSGRWEIWTVPLEGNGEHLGKPEAFLRSSFSASAPAFSPDGRWLAYASNESGSYEVYMRPFPGPGGKFQISTGGGSYPVWSRNGGQLFFLNNDRQIIVADYTVKGDSFVAGKPRLWWTGSLPYVGWNYSYDVRPDGKGFAAIMEPPSNAEQKATESVTVLLNFFDELRRKVPKN